MNLRWWAKFVAIQTLTTALLLEAALHWYQPLPFRVRGDRIVLPVHAKYTFHNDGPKLDRTVHHTKNSLGFRGPEPPRDSSAAVKVIAIGGSTTECLFLSDGNTWVDQMATRLKPAIPNLWVNNAGLDGQSTFGHSVLLRQVVIGLRPEFAVFLIGVNDMGLGNLNRFDARLSPLQSAWSTIVSRAAEHVETIALLQNLVRAHRARFQGLGHAEIPLQRWPRLALDDTTIRQRLREYAPTLPSYAARLEAIIQLCREAGIEPVFITQPALVGEGIDPSTGIELGTLRVFEDTNGMLQWRLLEMTNDVTREVAAAHDVPLIDLARELPKDSRLYYDLWHFSNEGAVRVGDIVASHLARVMAAR